MSDLEDDVLMAFLAQGRRMATLKERNALLDRVWKNTDLLIRALYDYPNVTKELERELLNLKGSVVAVLDFDEAHPEPGESGE